MTTNLKKDIRIGTSGWNYGGWREIFYPSLLKSADFLKFYSQHFSTVEINYSFYHLPRPATFQKWRESIEPINKNFIFAVKASRFMTHIKRLKNIKTAWKIFINNASILENHLGPILFQFPASFKLTAENQRRLENFLKTCYYPKNLKNLQLAFEFRHNSWFTKKIYKILQKYNAALVFADSSRYPKIETITADFIYIRMHGPEALFASKYSDADLKLLAQKIKQWIKKVKQIYVYFNNDFYGYAIENAKTLKQMLNIK